MFQNFKEYNDSVESFDIYIRRLEQNFILFDIKDEKKLSALITFIGPKLYNLLTNLVFPDLPESKTYAEIVDVLTKHLCKTPNKITERIKFRKCFQGENESVQDFSVRLKKFTTHCAFTGDTLSENLLEQFLRGLKNETIQSKLMSQVEDLTFEKALEQAVTMQSTENDMVELQNKNLNLNKLSTHRKPKQNYSQNNVNKQNANKTASASKIHCYRCGNSSHLANVCKFINAVCKICKKRGHLSKVCRNAQNNVTQKKSLNVLDTVDILSLHSESTKPIKIWVLIENSAKAEMELDSGSAISAVPINRFRRLFPEHKIFPADVQLKTATGEIFQPEGFVRVNVTYKNKTRNVKLYLVKMDNFPLLLGRDWITTFNIFPNNLQTVPVNKVTISENLNNLLNEFPDLFTNNVGEIKNVKAELHLEKDATPIFCKTRTVTYALRNAVNEELERLENEGIIKPVSTSKWATPIVPVVKPNGKIRLCGDFKVTVNKFLKVDKYPLPKIEDILATLGGGIHFTKIDLNQAYLHLPVEENSQELLTINTPKGLFQFTRLPYGIASSPAIWQRTIEQILKGIEGISVFIDDICISGETDEIHLERLKQVLERLREYNLKINKEKSFFMNDEITYCGYKIDKNGIHKTQEKISAILNAPTPKNVTQVKAFLGLVSYYSRFVPKLSTIAYPLNELLRKNVKFRWTKNCENSFNTIKQEITSERILTHFNPKLPLILATDASPYGISAVLSHTMPDNSEKPIAFVSRTLSSAEKRYSQVDKEALSIIFGVKKFFQFLYGRRFTLYTDSKPLVSIFSPTKSIPVLSAARMQRYALYLQTFQYDIKYKKSADHGNADALSRLPLCSEDLLLPSSDPSPLEKTSPTLSPNLIGDTDETDGLFIHQITTLPLTTKVICTSSKRDPILKEMYQHLISGTEMPNHLLFGHKQEDYSLLNNCILQGNRVVIPTIHRQKVLQDLHFGHFGIVKMKALARSFVWWPGIDKDIEDLANNCSICIRLKHNPPKMDTHHWEWPTTPWQRIHTDFFGPVMGKMFLIVVDAHSKWPEVFIVPSTTAENTINCLSSLFARYGYPVSLVSDNGPQFTSEQFEHFLQSKGIKHSFSAPYHPATNGQAERYVQIIKKGLKSLSAEPGNLQFKLNEFLLQYRIMPHITTGESPASLFLKRNIRSKLDLLVPNVKNHVENKQHKNAFNMKKVREFQINEKVAVRNYLSGDKWKIGKIIARVGKLHYKIQVGPCVWKRHIDQITSVGSRVQLEETTNTSESEKKIIDTDDSIVPSNKNSHLKYDGKATSGEKPSKTPDPEPPDARPSMTPDPEPPDARKTALSESPTATPDPVPTDRRSVMSTKSKNTDSDKNFNSTPDYELKPEHSNVKNTNISFPQQVLRRSNRNRKPPIRYGVRY